MPKVGPSSSDRQQRIVQLQSELAQLLQDQPAADEPHPAPSAAQACATDAPYCDTLRDDQNAWLTGTISHLFKHDDEQGLRETMQALGHYLQLDRCGLGRFSTDENSLITVPFDWSRGSLPPVSALWGGMTAAAAPKVATTLLNNQTLLVEDVHTAETLDEPVRASLQQVGIRAAVVIPLSHHGQLDCFLSLSQCDTPRHWTQQDLQIASQIGDLLGTLLNRLELAKSIALRESRYVYAMEASREGFWDIDFLSNHVYVSPSYLNMLGYEVGELPINLETYQNLVLPESADSAAKAMQAAAAAGQQHLRFEVGLRHKSGAALWIDARARILQDAEGRLIRCVGINADVTEQRQQQQDLLKAKTQAEVANVAKDEFLARMSHESRTPLNAIVGLSHLLQDTALAPEQRGYLQQIDHAARDQLLLLDQILDFGALGEGKLILNQDPFDLPGLLEQVRATIAAELAARQLDIEFALAADAPATLLGDQARLLQVLLLLIRNAINFSECGAIQVKIDCLQQGPARAELAFSITDQGIGIAPAQLASLFEPFTQADGSATRKVGGTGLGLSLCKELVALMQGQIHVQSTPGQGSQFRFNAFFDRTDIADAVIDETLLSRAHILLAEDNPVNQQIAAGLLRKKGVRVTVADNGRAAVDTFCAAAEGEFDAVLMDMEMPEMDGYQATRQIRAGCHRPDIPIIALTAHALRGDRALCLAAGTDAYLTKPVDRHQLYVTLSQFLQESLASLA